MKSEITMDPVAHEAGSNPQAASESTRGRRPEWLRVKLNQNEQYWRLKTLMRG